MQNLAHATAAAVVFVLTVPSSRAHADAVPAVRSDALVATRSFKEARVRPLDTSRVAVHAPSAEAREALFSRLAVLGIDPASLVPIGRGDLWTVALSASSRSPAGVDGTLDSLLADPRLPFAGPVLLDDSGGPIIALPSILVQFRPGVGPVQAAAIISESAAGEIVEYDRMPGNIHRVAAAGRDGFDVLHAANALAAHDDVLFAECDQVMNAYPAYVPNDGMFPFCWALSNPGGGNFVAGMDVGATGAWDITKGDPDVIVAVIDCGVDQSHPDINQVTPGMDLTGGDGDGGPETAFDSHGTPVAGLISARIDNGFNGGGVGVCPECRTISIKMALDDEPGNGSWITQSSWIADAVYGALWSGARITSASFSTPESSVIATAYAQTSPFMLHFASAGNVPYPLINFPAKLSSCLAVAALDGDGELTYYSAWGAELDFAAPGHELWTADRQGDLGFSPSDFTSFSGTSAATPIAAGVAAIIWSANPGLDAAEVLAIMKSTAIDLGAAGLDSTFGHGLPRAFEGAQEALFGPCGEGGNCFDNGGSRGCAEAACCVEVCSLAPTCCTDSWDSICQQLAVPLCTECGTGSPATCFTVHAGGGCGNSSCCAIVCEIDADCCLVAWDQKCVNDATTLCPPVNDSCEWPTTIAAYAAVAFSTANASTAGAAGGTCDFDGDGQVWKDLWFAVKAPIDGYLTASTCGATFDTRMAIYPGAPELACPSDGSFSAALGCNDDGEGCGTGSKLSVAVHQGETYLVRVGGASGAGGAGTLLTSFGIPNDTCGSALTIGGGPTAFCTLGAATNGSEACTAKGYAQIGADIWLDYVATSSDKLLLTTCGDADFDTKIALYGPMGPNKSCANLPLMACNDDGNSCGDGGSEISTPVVAGKTYRIRVGGYQGAAGHGVLTIGYSGAPFGDLNADGAVNGADLGLLLGAWGDVGPADLDGSGVVDSADLGLLLGAWTG